MLIHFLLKKYSCFQSMIREYTATLMEIVYFSIRQGFPKSVSSEELWYTLGRVNRVPNRPDTLLAVLLCKALSGWTQDGAGVYSVLLTKEDSSAKSSVGHLWYRTVSTFHLIPVIPGRKNSSVCNLKLHAIINFFQKGLHQEFHHAK